LCIPPWGAEESVIKHKNVFFGGKLHLYHCAIPENVHAAPTENIEISRGEVVRPDFQRGRGGS